MSIEITQHIELLPLSPELTNEQLEEIDRIRDHMARAMDAEIMRAFTQSRRRMPDNPRLEIVMTPHGESAFSRAIREAYINGSGIRVETREGDLHVSSLPAFSMHPPREVQVHHNFMRDCYKFELAGTDHFVEVAPEVLIDGIPERVVKEIAIRLTLPQRGEITEQIRTEADAMARQLAPQIERLLESLRYRFRRTTRANPFAMFHPFPDGTTRPYAPFTPLPTCAQCNKPGLKQTYTSTRDGREICAGCFEGLQDKGLAREQGQPLKKKARHPLDAWMDEKVD